MLGAIVGDIIGSVHEYIGTKTTEFPLFVPGSDFTDDSVLTVAVADWTLTGGDPSPEGHPVADRAAVGRRNENVAPGPGLDSAQSRPPWASMIERLIARPRPMPCGFVV
jgi:ADP-ribosylglycohydrolase